MARQLVVHCKRAPFDVYIGRSSYGMESAGWGNPFRLERGNDGPRSRALVIAAYRRWLLEQPDLVARAKRELRGKVLGCWCAPLPCHGDVLAEIANEER